jgi:polyhydroxyalkanoate synthesis regulator phasin
MADQGEKPSDAGVVSRLAGRGEEAVTRLMEELGKNPRVTDALGRAMSAKGRVDETTRKTLAQLGLAPADEVKDLQSRVDSLEQRLAQVEGKSAARTSGGRRPSTSEPAEGSAPGTRSPSGGPGTPADSPGSGPPRGGGSDRTRGAQRGST